MSVLDFTDENFGSRYRTHGCYVETISDDYGWEIVYNDGRDLTIFYDQNKQVYIKYDIDAYNFHNEREFVNSFSICTASEIAADPELAYRHREARRLDYVLNHARSKVKNHDDLVAVVVRQACTPRIKREHCVSTAD